MGDHGACGCLQKRIELSGVFFVEISRRGDGQGMVVQAEFGGFLLGLLNLTGLVGGPKVDYAPVAIPLELLQVGFAGLAST